MEEALGRNRQSGIDFKGLEQAFGEGELLDYVLCYQREKVRMYFTHSNPIFFFFTQCHNHYGFSMTD